MINIIDRSWFGLVWFGLICSSCFEINIAFAVSQCLQNENGYQTQLYCCIFAPNDVGAPAPNWYASTVGCPSQYPSSDQCPPYGTCNMSNSPSTCNVPSSSPTIYCCMYNGTLSWMGSACSGGNTPSKACPPAVTCS